MSLLPNPKLVRYIEENVFPEYEKNDAGHQIDHIEYVIRRSLKFAETIPEINVDMVYAIAAYHDVGHHIDAENHEKVSAEILREDRNLRDFFSKMEIKTMAEAIYDHRSSMAERPRTIYGEIVSSADRNTNLELPLKRTYAYRLEHSPDSSLEDIIEESRMHLMAKFGRGGYAREKMYFEDPDYDKFLRDITALTNDKARFREAFLRANNLS